MSEYPTIVGTVTTSHYNETMKAIRFILSLDNGHEVRMEWPITMFNFSPKMDRDEEMRKTADIMIGKRIKVISTSAEPTE